MSVRGVLNMMLRVFACSYALCKELFNHDVIHQYTAKNPQLQLTIKGIIIVLATLLIIVVFALIIPFVLFRTVVHLYLKLHFGKDFGAFLEGISPMFEVNREKSTIITVFMLEKDLNFYKKLKQSVKLMHESNFRFSSVVRNCLGYKYYLTNQVRPEHVLNKVVLNDNETITKDDLLTYLENYKVIYDRKMWEVNYFEQPLVDDDNNERIAFMIRINHCVTDAFYMIALFKKYLQDPVVSAHNETDVLEKINVKRSKSLDDLYLNHFPIIRDMDEFLFQGSQREFMVTFMEDSVDYVPRIKKIKNKLGVGFTDVLLAAVVASTSEFLTKKLGRCSNKMNIWLTTRGRIDDVVKILNGSFDSKELSNEFAMLAFSAPTIAHNESAINGLKDMSRSCTAAKSSIDTQLAYLCPKLQWQYLPSFMQKFIFKLISREVCLMNTNMAAVDESTIAQNKVMSIMAYTALYMDQGMMLNTVTYNGRLQTTLVGRLKFLDDRAELQSILDNMFKYIDKVEQELEKCSGTNGYK